MADKKPETVLLLSDAHGVYLPRDFAQLWSKAERAGRVTGVSDEDWAILEAGPDHESYWDVWCEVEQDARVFDDKGNVYRVYQDSDCFLIPVGMVWSDSEDTFVWPEDEEQDDES